MGVLAKVGHQATSTGLGAQTIIVGSPFSAGSPIQLPLLIPTRRTVLGWSGNESIFMGMGAGLSSTVRHSAMGVSRGNFGAESHRSLAGDRIYSVPQHNANTLEAEADLTSLGENIVLDWTDASPAARIELWAALAGITDVGMFSIAETSGTQNLVDDSIDFEPSLAFIFQNGANADDALNSKMAAIWGACNAAGEQIAFDCTTIEQGGKGRWLRDDRVMTVNDFDGLDFSAHFSQMLAPGEVATGGGVQIIWDEQPPVSDKQILKVVVFGGVSSKIGLKTKSTGAAPAVDTVALGFEGAFSLFLTAFLEDELATDHNRGCVGLFDGTNKRCYAWTDEDGANPASCFAYLSNTEGLVKADHNTGSTGGVEASGVPSYSGDDLLMTWNPNDADPMLWGHVTLGPPEAAPPPEGESAGRARRVVIV